MARSDREYPVASGAMGLHRSCRDLIEIVRLDQRHPVVSVRTGNDALWLLIDGRVLLRTAYAPGGLSLIRSTSNRPDEAMFDCDTAFGRQSVAIRIVDGVVSASVTLVPAADLLMQHWPRDLFPVDAAGDPLTACGRVEAAQRGYNAAILYLSRSDGAGAALYLQNLTALNSYFKTTGTKPDAVVGGRWPHLGYAPPVAPQFPGADESPLAAGKPVVLSDARVAVTETAPTGPRHAAALFLEMLGTIYPTLTQPPVEHHDWDAMARRTLAVFGRDERLSVRHYGKLFVRPYVGFGQPDSMAQLAIARPMTLLPFSRDFAGQLVGGMGRFFDRKLGTIRRFLPNVVRLSREEGDEKNPNEVDSWYLYHPLASLGTLALAGDKRCRRLLLGSLDFAIRVARHFDYRWPILFDVESLKVTEADRGDGVHGQTDVGGLYADVMLKAWDLTGEQRYLDEAQKAVKAMADLRFEATYQTNLVARGLMPCARLWQITGDRFFLDQSQMLLASFLHNTIMWESEIDHAVAYRTFLGATCLHDGPYMAVFECFESAEALVDYLDIVRNELPGSVVRIIEDYVRHALSRAWYFYPQQLGAAHLSDEVRSGETDSRLAIPLEDLYADGQPAGQVGQEVYGAGAAFAFAALQKRVAV